MSALIDLKQRKFGLLKVAGHVGGGWWECRCKCGGTTTATSYDLRTGHTTSCGCAQRVAAAKAKQTHGFSGTPTYKSWCSMRARCENPRSVQWKWYGGRGVKVCRRWREFDNFLADMGERPSLRHSIDRKDPDGNYGPDNCQWNLKGQGTQRTRKR